MINNRVLATFEEALVSYKEQIKELEKIISIVKKDTNSNKDEVSNFKDIIEKQKTELTDKINKLIDDVTRKIPKVEKVNYTRIETSIKAKINRYIREKDTDISEVRADLKAYARTIMPKDGIDGKDADNEVILKDLKAYINSNKESFRGVQGNNIKGEDGKNGVDGVGIKDIYEIKNYLYIELTNGKIKKFKIPSKTIYSGGGGGSATGSTVISHKNLLDKDSEDSHPISAITGLTAELQDIVEETEMLAMTLS